MLTNTYQILIRAQSETIWNLLLDNLKSPEKYFHGINSVVNYGEAADGIAREILWEGKLVREKIIPEQHENRIVHKILEHPLYNGRVIVRIVPTSVQSPMAPVMLQVVLELDRNSFKVEGIVKTDAEIVADIESWLQVMKTKSEEIEGVKK